MESINDPRTIRQNLLIDADDTLWENNIYFEHAITTFISFLEHKELTPDEVREVIYRVEHENIKIHGYGIASFAKALVKTFEELSVEPITPALHETVLGFAKTIAERPIEHIAGVEDTLRYLHARHRLLLVTKGNYDEQYAKVTRSNLSRYFESVEIVAEKDANTYGYIATKYDLDREYTWMIGNSPKSDVNPALEAGFNAVFVPHSNTWKLEHCELATARPPQALLTIESFEDLQKHF
jgi:putative hydrolase of the HAD superfamily